MGEPAGIGPEIILRAWNERKERRLPPFLVIGDAALLASRALALGLPVSTVALNRGEYAPPLASALPVISIGKTLKGKPAEPNAEDAAGVVEMIETGCEMAMSGEAAGLITCPIAKSLLYESGFGFPGHTEFLAELAGRKSGEKFRPVMMIAGPELRTIPVTIHIPLTKVAESLTRDLIVETVSIAARDLRQRFGVESPRFAVCGLNPHAGENGTLGREEIEIVAPAIRQLQSMGIGASGPFPADTLFHRKVRGSYDAAVCMYHDQALIPAKTLAFDEGVNVTLGLPFIRTSPDHGTAFDIAAQGKADPSSFCAALRMAHEMARHAAHTSEQ
jgi:4-hydroxythreonine-4-phosphate dehydrogenase